ncbi:cold shock protein (beta-ribbon, CspA family) [Pseudovibrio sp. Tun.PSC04-5.I4]|nr:cold-shock protein [Pseudovibrio sp. Tun.PSC04-5.I4]SDR34525.1 cold shock protein (beta-ribbon, CspA family) [Pseudovibrio sp. Tun.PSC04-5.I4]
MHNGNSGRRPRSKRGGKREFGDSQDFGPEFGAPSYFPSDTGRDAYAPPPVESGNRGLFGNRGPGANGGDRNDGYRANGHGDNNRSGGEGGGGGFRDGPDGGGGSGGRRSYPPVERGPRQSGIVKFFKQDKGFGFITPDEGSTDVFVHISAVERSGLTTLDSGQSISFETEPDRRGKGPKAVELRLEDGAAATAEEPQSQPEMADVGQD